MDLNRRDFIKGSLATGAMALGGVTSAQSAPEVIMYKSIPSTGEQLPVIGFGTNQYGSGTDETIRATLMETLKVFTDNGGTLLDTSSHYRGSESVLGSMLAEMDMSGKAFISTKAGQFDDLPLETKLNNSHTHFGVDQLDLYQIHNVAFQDWRNMLPQLQEWKQEGKIRYIGITGSEDVEHPEIAEAMRTESVDFVQLNYNVGDRNIEKELLPIARDRGIAVVGNVPFGQGSLFSAVSGVELPEFAKEFCLSWSNFFLKYNVSHPDVTATIPGTSKPHHALDNVQAGMGRLPTATERKMQEEFIASL